MNSEGQASQRAELDEILSDLQYLNLTGSVQYDTSKWPIARGGFGDIYRGHVKRQDGTNLSVAVKCLRVYLGHNRNVARVFRREIMAWSRLRHPNVLPLLGYVLEETSDHVLQLPSLISEWMENGNILDFVRSNPNFNIVGLALGMAEGLAYLHDNNVVHSDFKSGNVLISCTGEPVISDFGAAHVTFDLLSSGNSSTVTDLRGTSRWLAYELLANADQYPSATKQSDTWAFGMTLCEILTNEHPFAQYQYDVQVILAIMNRKLPSPPEEVVVEYKRQLWDVCTECWNCNPVQRPAMADVSCRIKNIPISVNTEIGRSCQSQTGLGSRQVGKDVVEMLRTEFPQLELSERLDIKHEEDPCRVDELARYFNGFLGSQRISVKKFRALPSILNSICENIMAEIRTCTSIKGHPHVEAQLGYSLNLDGSLSALVYKYIGSKTLLQYVRSTPQCNIVELALGVASGLSHIHAHNFMHGDIKSENILVTANGCPVISGFNYSALLVREGYNLYSGGSSRWMSPETIIEIDTWPVSKARDVWAFGMTVYELLSGNIPYNDIRGDGQAVLHILRGRRPVCPPSYSNWKQSRKILWSICQACWHIDPEARPGMNDLVKELEGIIAIQKYIDT